MCAMYWPPPVCGGTGGATVSQRACGSLAARDSSYGEVAGACATSRLAENVMDGDLQAGNDIATIECFAFGDDRAFSIRRVDRDNRSSGIDNPDEPCSCAKPLGHFGRY